MSNSRPSLSPFTVFIYSLLVERCKIVKEVSKRKEPGHGREEYPGEKHETLWNHKLRESCGLEGILKAIQPIPLHYAKIFPM